MIQGRFDTDTAALAQRIHSHDQYGSRDLNVWIFEHLQPAGGMAVLDLGCGTGKQSLPLAATVGPSGRVLAVDVAAEALAELSSSAAKAGLNGRLRVLCSGLDDLGKHVAGGEYDRALGSFSLYYAKDPRRMLGEIHRALRPGGILFFCGPSRDNNAELKRFHYALHREELPAAAGRARFMEEEGPRLVHGLFFRTEVVLFENPLRFDSPDSLYAYWSSHNLYDDRLDAEFKAAALKFFEKRPVFETVKRVIGVKAVK